MKARYNHISFSSHVGGRLGVSVFLSPGGKRYPSLRQKRKVALIGFLLALLGKCGRVFKLLFGRILG